MKKRLLASILCAAVAAGTLFGCSSSTSSGSSGSTGSTGGSTPAQSSGSSGGASQAESSGMSENGVFPIVQEKMTFRIMSPQVGYILNMNTNDFGKWYEEQTNIHIEYDLFPSEAAKEKINLALTSGDYPDAFMGCNISATDQVKYGSQGVFIPLNDLIENYSTDFKAAMEPVSILPQSITAPDGNIYALPHINECYHCFYAGRSWINQTWLDNLGLSYPETTDDFYNVLKAFKEQDANGNGDPNDEIPMMGSNNGWNSRVFDGLLNSFVYNDYGPRLALQDGKINFVANTEDFRDGLRYVRKLIAENLIDPVSLTQTDEQGKVIGGDPEVIRVGVVTSATYQSLLGDELKDPLERHKQYVGLSPLKGPKGVRNTLTEEGGVTAGQFLITNKCENPEVLFRWADGAYKADVTLYSQVGPEGVAWQKPADGVLGINGEPALYQRIEWTEDTVQNYKMENIMLANRTMDFRHGEAVDPNDPEAVWRGEPRRYSETKAHFEPYRSDMALPPLMLTPEEADERSMLQTPIDDYSLENIVAFLAGNKDVETDWDAYVKEYDNLNLSRYLEIIQTAYDRQYGSK